MAHCLVAFMYSLNVTFLIIFYKIVPLVTSSPPVILSLSYSFILLYNCLFILQITVVYRHTRLSKALQTRHTIPFQCSSQIVSLISSCSLLPQQLILFDNYLFFSFSLFCRAIGLLVPGWCFPSALV